MEEAARRRRERLLKAQGISTTEKGNDTNEAENESVVEKTVESEAKAMMEQSKINVLKEEESTVNIADLAPKRPHWDLKRNLEPKLAILEERTKGAIMECVRKRITEQQQ